MGEAKLYFNYGVMGSSKTANALITRFTYESLGKNVLLIKPSVDTRDGEHIIKSRIGIEHECFTFNELVELRPEHIKQYDCLVVDEAQFLLKKEVQYLAHIVVDEYNVPVVCYGLLSDFKGELFEGSAELVVLANKLSEIKTVCWCGKKAMMNTRFNENGEVVKSGEQIVIGANDKYTSLCRKHWHEGNLGPNFNLADT